MKKKLILFFLLWLFGIAAIFILSRLANPIPVLIYWIILGLLISALWLFKLKSRFVLLLSFGLLILGGAITAFSANFIAETILRISLIGWLVGFTQSIFEYFSRKPQDKT